jgi:hypothetical protein
MKKDMKVWAIKLRGRSFYKDSYGVPYLYPTQSGAKRVANSIAHWGDKNPMNTSPSTEAVRVRVRIEEII